MINLDSIFSLFPQQAWVYLLFAIFMLSPWPLMVLYRRQDYTGKNAGRMTALTEKFGKKYVFALKFGELRIISSAPHEPNLGEILEMIKILWLNGEDTLRSDIVQGYIPIIDSQGVTRFTVSKRTEYCSDNELQDEIVFERCTDASTYDAHVMAFDIYGKLKRY